MRDPALFGVTTDALIWHGRWPIVGNCPPVLESLPRPFYKIQMNGKWVIEDFGRKVVRDATAEDIAFYDLRWSRTPMCFQVAMEALHGRKPWNESDDQLLVTHAARQASLQPAQFGI